MAFLLKLIANLTDRGCLPYPINPDKEDHGRTIWVLLEGDQILTAPLIDLNHFLQEDTLHIFWLVDTCPFDFIANGISNGNSHRKTNICPDKGFFQVLIKLLIHFTETREEISHNICEVATGLSSPLVIGVNDYLVFFFYFFFFDNGIFPGKGTPYTIK